MSLKALVETVIHLESFRNIELFYQGLYYVKVRLLCENQQGKYMEQLKIRQKAERLAAKKNEESKDSDT
jgi:hypothetical protein